MLSAAMRSDLGQEIAPRTSSETVTVLSGTLPVFVTTKVVVIVPG